MRKTRARQETYRKRREPSWIKNGGEGEIKAFSKKANAGQEWKGRRVCTRRLLVTDPGENLPPNNKREQKSNQKTKENYP
jgi:hypothetical protein